MLGTYYYHEILRKTIIAFGTIFNDIHIRHRDGAGKETSDMRVPLAYGPMQKFLARLEQQPDLNKPIQIKIPFSQIDLETIDTFSAKNFHKDLFFVKILSSKLEYPIHL